jgi:hypothetical protein
MVARLDFLLAAGVQRLENGGPLCWRAACERLAVFAESVAIHPPQSLAESRLLVFERRSQNVVHVTVDQSRLRSRSVGRRNDQVGEGDDGFVLVIVEQLRLPRRRRFG